MNCTGWQMIPGARFSKVLKRFRTRESHGNLLNLMITALFYSQSRSTSRGFLHTRSFRRTHQPRSQDLYPGTPGQGKGPGTRPYPQARVKVLGTRLAYTPLWFRIFRGFRDTGPRSVNDPQTGPQMIPIKK